LGWRPGSTPLLFLEAALRKNGIDPKTDVKWNNNIGIPARMGAWLSGQNDFAIFQEPDVAQLEADGKGHFLVSIGATVGPADYTSFMATDRYIREHPQIVQSWTNAIYKAQKWTESASAEELATAFGTFFPTIKSEVLASASERYRKLKIWKTTPVIEPTAIERFQDILVEGGILERAKRVRYQDLVLSEFAEKAK
jgi:NitT/TauT family transport system substrate-binding protein